MEKEPVLRDLARALAFRTFTAKEKNSFFEKNIVTENISEVACFFMAMGMTLDGKVEDSRNILEYLISNVKDKMKRQINRPQLKIFYDAIIACLTTNLYSNFVFIYEKHLIYHITVRSYDEYANQCLDLLNRLVEINRRTSDFYLLQAIINFHFNKIKAALDSVDLAKKYSPKNNPAPHFSSAFLHLWKGEYKRALREYKRAEQCTSQSYETIISVITFLQSLLNNQPEKIEIRFALAFMNERFYDTSQAIQDYKTFIEEAQQRQHLYLLRDYAQRRLGILEGKDKILEHEQ